MPSHLPCHHHIGFPLLRAIFLLFILPLLLTCGCTPDPITEEMILPPLPYSMDALAPIISSKTMNLHYKKHHAGYVAKANVLIKKSRFKRKTVAEILMATRGEKEFEDLFNNTAQAWNHTFFWSCLTPDGSTRPTGPLAMAINKEFGGWQNFRRRFIEAAVTHFGSGWAWVVSDNGKLRILTTVNADTPIAMGLTPLFTIDLWEHAYYLDVQNRRTAYVKGVFDELAHWKAVEARFQP